MSLCGGAARQGVGLSALGCQPPHCTSPSWGAAGRLLGPCELSTGFCMRCCLSSTGHCPQSESGWPRGEGKAGAIILGKTQLYGGFRHPLQSGVGGTVGTAATILFAQGWATPPPPADFSSSGSLVRFGAKQDRRTGRTGHPAPAPQGCSPLQTPRLLKSSAPGDARAPLLRTPAHPRAVSSLHKVASTPEISWGKAWKREARGNGESKPPKSVFLGFT